MQIAEEWLKTWICLSLVFGFCRGSRPRFDISTDMGMVLVPMDAEVDSAIFRLRATDQDADFPLTFEIIATTSPVVRIENLPCTLYNKVCQANVVLTRRLVAGRLHDFVIRVRDTRGDTNSMQATISVTNATTPRDKIFPHVPSLIMVPEDTKPEKELDYLLVESNPWSGKPVYIELWQPKELFKIRQRQVGSQTKGVITLIGELDFETQSMYTLTMYATDPFTEPGKDSRNIAGIHVVVIVQDVQDVPPAFTLAPPLTKLNNSIKPGDLILRVHAEDGDKGVPREVTYGLISEGNPFTPFFNVSETTGEIILAKPLEELTKITHVGAPIVLKIVAEEIRTSREEPPAQATVVELGLLLGEPGNSPPYFENDNYAAWIDENAEPGSVIVFSDAYTTRVRDEDIGKAGVFALKLDNNNGTFEVSPTVAERTADFIITVRDNALIDYERFKSLRFKIVAEEVGPATNLSTSVPVTIFLNDVNDNPPVFDSPVYEVTLSENAKVGTRVIQVHATDKDSGAYGKIQYTKISGLGNEAFHINPDTGMITVSSSSFLDREKTSRLGLTVESRDEDGRGLKGTASLVVNILDVNDNPPVFEKGVYEFLLNSELTNFTMPAFIKAVDADAEAPNNVVRYELVHGNYDNKFRLNEETGELTLREPIDIKPRKARQSDLPRGGRKKFRGVDLETLANQTDASNFTKGSGENETEIANATSGFRDFHLLTNLTQNDLDLKDQSRQRRAEDDPLFVLTARAYDLGVPHLSSVTQIRVMRPMSALARTVMFVMPGENPDPTKTAETLALITGSRVTIQEIRPYIQINSGNGDGKRSVVVARVEQNGPGTLVDVAKIKESLAEKGFGVISGMDGDDSTDNDMGRSMKNISSSGLSNEEVTVYKAENKLLTWLLALLGLFLLAAIVTLVLCCICPSCPFYMEPRKRRIHSSETLVARSDGRPKRHLHRKPFKVMDVGYALDRKEAWSADRQPWQFNRRNTKTLGRASLPGDAVPQDSENFQRAGSMRNNNQEQRHSTVVPMDEHRIYMEDVEHGRNYDQGEIDSLRRHELERGSDRNGNLNGRQVREQHFYRDGNAEVLRLVTRGEIEDRGRDPYQANGKDILLQRFIEDQKLRRSQDLRDSFQESIHEGEIDRSMESQQQQQQHPQQQQQRVHETTEILILPERLEMQRQPAYSQRQNQQQDQMMNADIQRLLIERTNYKSSKEEDPDDYRTRTNLRLAMRDTEGETPRSMDNASAGRDGGNPVYGVHEVELVRQNALLTRLLLERESSRGLTVPILDTTSFLETQSLPGQVAIATQTDRSAATQTEFITRSRSDNEESEEDPRMRRKTKLSGRVETKEDLKKMKTIWVRTPIPEESSKAQSGNKKSTPTRTKIEVMESRKISISPDALKSDEEEEEEEEDDEEVEDKRGKVQTDKMQKVVCASKKKVKEARVDDDSTTPSPESKEKSGLLRAKLRKKIEKPPRKKFQKGTETDKSFSAEPSFRVLEKEISSFQQKLRQFGDKKLKILSKDKDNGKKSDESEEADSGATYGISSSKCEVTVKRTNRSVSRESSPTKITVESKTKTSEEESTTKERIIVTQQQNASSSDVEDNEKSKKSSSVTRNRSQLRRQTRLENSDTKSSSEKIVKSDESESKVKESSSSAELKADSSKKQMEIRKAQTMDKKTLISQKSVPKSRITEMKQKTAVAKSKTLEEPAKKMTKKDTKSSSDDNKSSSSPVKSKDTLLIEKSEEEKTSVESLTINLDKLAQDVRGVVEKEISSLTQAAKDAINSQIAEGKSSRSPSKSKGSSPENVGKSKNKPTNSLKEKRDKTKSPERVKRDEINKTMKSPEKVKQSKTTEVKDKMKESVTKVKSDDAISFIVIEKNETAMAAAEHGKVYEETNGKDKIVRNGIKNGDKKKSPEKLGNVKTFDMSFKVNESQENLADRVEDTRKIIADEITKTETKLSNGIDKTKQTITSKIDAVKEPVSGTVDDTKTIIFEIVGTAGSNVVQVVDESKQNLTEKLNETKNEVQEAIDKSEKIISEKIVRAESMVSDEVNETKKSLSEHLSDTEKMVSDKIDRVEKNIAEKIDETKTMISENLSSGEKIVDTRTVTSENLPKDEQMDETRTTISENLSKTEKSNEIDKMTSDKAESSVREVTEEKLETNIANQDAEKESSETVSNVPDSKIIPTESSSESPTNETEHPKYQILIESADEQKADIPSEEAVETSTERKPVETLTDQMMPEKQDIEESSIKTPSEIKQTEDLAPPSQSPETTELKQAEIQPAPETQSRPDENFSDKKLPKSPTKLRQPARPMLKSQSAIDDHLSNDDDDSSSSSSDVSNKTALHTKPYSTPRGSISMDFVEAEAVRPRPRWHAAPEEPTPKVLSKKIEVSDMDKLKRGGAQKMDAKSTQKTEAQPSSRPRPVVVAVKRKEQRTTSERMTTNTTSYSKQVEEKKGNSDSERKVEIRSKHLKLQVSHHHRSSSKEETSSEVSSPSKDPEIANARSRYMAWYQQKRAEMERKRKEKKEAEEEQLRPKWVRGRGTGRPPRKSKSAEDTPEQRDASSKTQNSSRERARSSSEAHKSQRPQISRLNIKPLVNVESEQLKAIVRQGRKLRKTEGSSQDPPVQIFAPNKPPVDQMTTVLQVEPRHHLIQHSEYKYEKTVVMPFYLHQPPPVPHPSPEHHQDDASESRQQQRADDDLDSGIAVSLQGTRLRHQQLLEKKSVFDIAYSEASPTQLRSDSSTPPS